MSGSELLNRQRRYRIPVQRLERFLARLTRRLKIGAQSFSVVLTNDSTIRRLNRDFRNKDKATDVLSFSCAPLLNAARLDNTYIGDMIVSVETAQRQALDRNHALERELCILMIHGLLHLLGYDHEVDRGKMRRKELKLQRELL